MVQIIMIFALGFVTASLIALLIIPAVNARAERLARRRAEALFPMSISELTAEKDHLRAEFAVLQRRLERKAEEAQAFKHQSMEELGRRAVRIEALETALADRDRAISQVEATLAETQVRLDATENELAQTKMLLSGIRETLSALENAHRATLDELSNTRMDLELAQTEGTRAKTELAQKEERLAYLEAEHADAATRLTTALSDLDARRIMISDLETRLVMQTARADDFERALAERDQELEEERRRLNELATEFASEQERGLALAARIRELEDERDEANRRLAAQENVADQDEELRRRISEVASRITDRDDGRSRNRKYRGDKRRKAVVQ